jgi:superoxide dismutase, Fe-Mn family
MFAVRRVAILTGRGLVARQKHTLPDLPYDYNALEPVISAEIMKLHHSAHHKVWTVARAARTRACGCHTLPVR